MNNGLRKMKGSKRTFFNNLMFIALNLILIGHRRQRCNLTLVTLRPPGIPCRPVTVFSVGRDGDDSMTIDYHYNKDGYPRGYNDDTRYP